MTRNNLEGMCKHHINALSKVRDGKAFLNSDERQCAYACNGYHNDAHNGCKFNPKKDVMTLDEYRTLNQHTLSTA